MNTKGVYKLGILVVIFAACLFFGMEEAWSQCPMCKAAAESNLKEGGTHALGLNAGIIYLFLMPYILVGSIAFMWWWKNIRSAKSDTSGYSPVDLPLSSAKAQ